MQAIRVTYIGPTNDHGSRYRAKCAAGSVTIPQVGEYDPSRNAAIVVGVLVRKLGWPEAGWTVGTLADGSYVAVHASGEPVPVGHTLRYLCPKCGGNPIRVASRPCRRCKGMGTIVL